MDEIELEIEAPEFQGAGQAAALGLDEDVGGVKEGDQDMEEGEIEDGRVEKIEIREIDDSDECRPKFRRNLSNRLGPRIQSFKDSETALPVRTEHVVKLRCR